MNEDDAEIEPLIDKVTLFEPITQEDVFATLDEQTPAGSMLKLAGNTI